MKETKINIKMKNINDKTFMKIERQKHRQINEDRTEKAVEKERRY